MAAGSYIGFSPDEKKRIYAERREKMARLVLDDKLSLAVVAARFNVHRGAVSLAVKEWRNKRLPQVPA